ncbi:MAG: biotin transporter BioY [Candidatus Methanoperedens sp.]|nr:biotin transporter BioY [Candidatus Methanoperedens sp.]
MSEFANGFKDIFLKYESAKSDFFKWRSESNMVNKLLLALSFACLTGLLAQLRFYLPYTPVPVTGQVFAVLLCGVVLGKWYGGASQGLYAAIGAAGVPWFTDGKAGLEILTGVTGGYILGFIAASLVIGWFTDSYLRSRSFAGILGIMILGIMLIYVFGVVQLWLVLGVNADKAIQLGALPFIGVDIYKALIASAMALAILPGKTSGSSKN